MAYAVVLTVSNRAAAGIYADTTGPLIVDALKEAGHQVDGPVVVSDGEPVRHALHAVIEAGAELVVTTGGTGISPTDRTPEMTRSVLDFEVPGIAEAIRAYGRTKTPTASLSRAIAGVAGRTLIVNLPGSSGAVKDGLQILLPLVGHALSQLGGGDHPTGGAV